VVVALTLLFPFAYDLHREEFHGDESHWLTSSQLAFELFATGDITSDEWHDQFYLYTQPQVGKVAIGASLVGGGTQGKAGVIEYDWGLDPELNRQRGAIPSEHALWFGRLPGAVAGWLSVLIIWAIGSALGRADVGLLSAVLLASHPLWLANSRRTGMDSMALMFGIAAMFAAVRLTRTRQPAWLILFGGAIGLAASTKYTGLLGATGAILPVWVSVAREQARGRVANTVVGAVGAAALAAAIFIGTNPALYRDPIHGIARSLEFFRDQAAGMRSSFPTFASPTLVAAEIVDRAIWPVGFPQIVDTTLERSVGDVERHLRPGQYGTPVVGVGLAVALIAGIASFRRKAWRPLGVIGAVGGAWLAVTYGALVVSLPIWWERWHLGIAPAACLVAAVGLAVVGRPAMFVGGVAQFVAAVMIGPSFLNHGFWALLSTPWGAGLHAAAMGVILTLVVSKVGLPVGLKSRVRILAVPRALLS
jgi:4-amino-4-deoxy-L-arabinose transferase-like glycosyltransferase